MQTMVPLICDACGKGFERTLSHHNSSIKKGAKRVFCSTACSPFGRRRPTHITCLNCEVAFETTIKTGRSKFCSRSCAATYHNKSRKISRLCEGCEKEVKPKVIYCSNECKRLHMIKRWLEGENFPTPYGNVPTPLRDFLLEEAGNQCILCGWNDVHPITNKVPVQIDHKDGDSSNNLKENLQVLCPNCHSLTPTFGSLNPNKGRKRNGRTKGTN